MSRALLLALCAAGACSTPGLSPSPDASADAALDAAGGPHGDLPPPYDAPPVDSAPPGDGGACTHLCPVQCAAGFTCSVAGFDDFKATCLKKCATTSDCPAGSRCVLLFNHAFEPSVCVSNSVPALCPGIPDNPGWHCDFPGAQCSDANTLRRPYNEKKNHTCGSELIHCPKGCAMPDGGMGTPAASYCR
jgi:hypothetical protein